MRVVPLGHLLRRESGLLHSPNPSPGIFQFAMDQKAGSRSKGAVQFVDQSVDQSRIWLTRGGIVLA